MSDIVTLVNAAGETAPFKAADVSQAVAHGWQPATPERLKARKDAQGFVGGTKALLEGGARGLTAGLSDVVETRLGLATPEDIAARQAAHPYLSGLGSVAGGVGLAAGMATGLGEAGLAGLGGALATGALSGGVEGAGSALSQQLLENKGLRGEEIAHHALVGTLMGTLGAAGGEALAAGAKGLGKLAGYGAKYLESAEGKAAAKMAAENATNRQLLKFDTDPGLQEAMGKQLIDAMGAPGGTKEALKTSADKLSDLGSSIDAALEGASAPVSQEARSALTARLRDLAMPGRFETRPETWRKRVLLLADKLDDAEALTAGDLHEARKELDVIASKFGKATPMPRELAQARSTVSDELNTAMGPEWQALNKEYGSEKEFSKLLQNRRVQELRQGSPQGVGSDLLNSGAAAAVATGHPVVGAGLAAKAWLQSHPGAIPNMLNKLGATDMLKKVAELQDTQWGHGIAQLTAGAASAPKGLPTVADFPALAEQVRAAADNPTAVHGNLTDLAGGALHTEHPEIADNASVTANRAIQYLNAQLPKNPYGATLMGKWEPSPSQKAQWLEAYRTVLHPATAFTHPTPTAMQTLQIVYPNMYAQAQQRLLEQLQNKDLPYQARLRLSKVLGKPVSPETSPQFIQAMQAALAPAPGPEGQKGSARTAAASRAKQRVMSFKSTIKSEQTGLSRMMAEE